jgi:AcrR family transcriptional regulator
MSKGENTRQFIIEKAAGIFNRKGIAGTAISDIMEATDMAKGGIYRRFESKEEIVAEVFQHLSKKLAVAIQSAIKDKSSAKDKLFALLDLYHDKLVLSDAGGCVMLNFGTESDDTDPVICAKVGSAIKSAQQVIVNIFTEGIENGEFVRSLNAEAMGIKVFTILEGAMLTSRVFQDKRQMKLMTELIKKEIEGYIS